MANFEGHLHCAKPTQVPGRDHEVVKKFQVVGMDSILQRVKPIEEVFDPDEEVKKLWSVPKEQRRETLSEFKDKLARQREAWALCRTSIEQQIESNPDLSREQMLGIIKEFASYYGFTESHINVAESLINNYLEMHRKVEDVREKYPDDIDLIKILTGVEFTKKDAEDFTVSVGPMSIEIACSGFNAGRIKEKSKDPVVGFKYGGFATASNTSSPVNYIVINNDYKTTDPSYYSIIIPHEREHLKNRILARKLYGKGEIRRAAKERLNRGVLGFLRHKIIGKLFDFEGNFKYEYELKLLKKCQSAKDSEEKVFFHEEYMRLRREDALNAVKNEIIARKIDPNYVSWENNSSLFNVGGNYDFLADLRHWFNDPLYQEMAKKVLVDEYRDIIDEAIIAFDQLRENGFTPAETVAMLTDKRLAEWPKTVRRLVDTKRSNK